MKKSTKFREIFDRIERHDSKRETTKKRKLRDLLYLGEKVLVHTERIRKKDAPKNMYKPTMENISFFNREKKLLVQNRLKVNNTLLIYYFWFAPEDDAENINDKRFIRQELFSIDGQFI